jgi:hypothetical protein
MKKDYAHITFVLDNSISMTGLTDETIAGYNTFLEKQKAIPGEATFSLYEFLPNDSLEGPAVEPLKGVHNNSLFGGVWLEQGVVGFNGNRNLLVLPVYEFKSLKEVPNIDRNTYQCRTWTPLLDAMGYAIEKTGEKLAALKEKDRPSKVICVFLTDGLENKSWKYDKDSINKLITNQTNVYKWEFVFLGANIDAIAVGASYGIAAASSVNYAATGASVTAGYSAVSDAVTLTRSTGVSMSATLGDSAVRSKIFDGTYKANADITKTGT